MSVTEPVEVELRVVQQPQPKEQPRFVRTLEPITDELTLDPLQM